MILILVFEGVKKDDNKCQENILLLSSLNSNINLNISSYYGLGEIKLQNLKNIKCNINLNYINIYIDDFNDKYKYSNVILHPMIDNNYYTDERFKNYCIISIIKIVKHI